VAALLRALPAPERLDLEQAAGALLALAGAELPTGAGGGGGDGGEGEGEGEGISEKKGAGEGGREQEGGADAAALADTLFCQDAWSALLWETARRADRVAAGEAGSRAALEAAARALLLAAPRPAADGAPGRPAQQRRAKRRLALEAPSRACAKRIVLALGRACVPPPVGPAAADSGRPKLAGDKRERAPPPAAAPAALPRASPPAPKPKPKQLAPPPERPRPDDGLRRRQPPKMTTAVAAAAAAAPTPPSPPPPLAAARGVATALRCAAALRPFGGGGDGGTDSGGAAPGAGSGFAARWAAGLLRSAALPGRDGLDLPTALAILRALLALGARGAPQSWLAAVFGAPTSRAEHGEEDDGDKGGTRRLGGGGGGSGDSGAPAGLGLVYFSPEQAAQVLALLGKLGSATASRPPAAWARRALDKALGGGGGGGGGGNGGGGRRAEEEGDGGAEARAAAARLPTALLSSLIAGTAALGVVPTRGQADALVEEIGRRLAAASRGGGSAGGQASKQAGGGGGGGNGGSGRARSWATPPTQAQLRDVQRALAAWGYSPSHEVGRYQWAAVRGAGKAAAAAIAWRRRVPRRGARERAATERAAPSDNPSKDRHD